VFYLTGCVNKVVLPHLQRQELGFMNTPNIGNRLRSRWIWAADNGCFGKNYVGDKRWYAWLGRFTHDQASRCLFATAPDVPGDAAATLERSVAWLPRIRELGLPPALVAQDGLTIEDTPWAALDALFIGGTTDWKMSEEVAGLIRAAKDRGKWVHIGRVNSRRRYLYMARLGADSADGTKISFAPEECGPKIVGWCEWHRTNPPLPLYE